MNGYDSVLLIYMCFYYYVVVRGEGTAPEVPVTKSARIPEKYFWLAIYFFLSLR